MRVSNPQKRLWIFLPADDRADLRPKVGTFDGLVQKGDRQTLNLSVQQRPFQRLPGLKPVEGLVAICSKNRESGRVGCKVRVMRSLGAASIEASNQRAFRE
jgi:hypothetical protein